MKKRILHTLCLSALISLGLSLTSPGEERITDVSLIFSYDRSPEGGEEAGTLTADSSSSQFTVEGSEYLKADDIWAYGEQPIGEVELSANEGFYFPTAARNLFHLSGCGVQYQDAYTEDEGSTLILHVRFPRIDGTLPAPLSADWSGYEAVWDEAEGADRYEVQLMKDGRSLTTVSCRTLSHSFEDWINNEGSYTFRVRAFSSYGRKNSGWCSDTEALVITADEASLNGNGSWKEKNGKFLFLYPNGAFPQMAWRQIDGKWYFFDGDGYMVSQCYVRSRTSGLYHWIGTDGVWDESGDTEQPNRARYTVY